MDEMRKRKPEPTHLLTQGIFNLPPHIDMRGTGLQWCCIYTDGHWIAAQLNVIAVTRIHTLVSRVTYCTLYRWVQRSITVLGDKEILTSWVRPLVESNQWLKNLYLSVPSQALSIIRIGQGMDWLSVRIMWQWDIKLRYWWRRVPVGQHYKVAMSVPYHKSIPILIWP